MWEKGTGENVILGSESISDIDKICFENIVDPLDRLLQQYRHNCKITYVSATSLSVAIGQITCSNAAGTIRRMRANSSATTTTFSDLDTGAERVSQGYYVYAVADADADTFTIVISENASTPTGSTYYARIGYFYNNSSGDIDEYSISNDTEIYALELGSWEVKAMSTIYQAQSDGFVVVRVKVGGGVSAEVLGYTDSSSSPTTVVIADSGRADYGVGSGGFTMLVRGGDYWKVTSEFTLINQVYWIELSN